MKRFSLFRLPFGIRRLAADDKGVSAIELGVLMPVLVVLVTGIIDLSQGLSERFKMQQAVNRGLEMIQARPPQLNADEGEMNYDYIRKEAATGADVPLSKVILNRWLECNGTKMAFEESCADGDQAARYMELHIDKTYNGKLFLGNYEMEAAGAVRIQ